MRRFLLPLLILAWSVSSALPPVMHDAGDAAGMRLHWRVKPAARDSARWGVMWNIVDSTSYEGLEIALADGRYNDAFGREEAVIKHYRVNDGHRAVLHERKLASGALMRRKGCSIRMQRPRGLQEATLEVGVDMPEFALAVEPLAGSAACGYAATPVDTLLDEWTAVYLPEPKFAPFPDADSLRRYLLRPDDANEAEWVFYDFDGEPSRLAAGGNYRVATVADGSGGYDIYYLDGARVNAAQWEPMQLKGRLRPTGFAESYELYWLDAFGEEMPPESAADIESGSMLRLYFPMNKAQMRFRRVIPADNEDGK